MKPPQRQLNAKLRKRERLEVEILSFENIYVSEENAKSLPRPYLCLLENAPTHRNEPAHQHADMIYLGVPIGEELFSDPLIKWFSMEDVELIENSGSAVNWMKLI